MGTALRFWVRLRVLLNREAFAAAFRVFLPLLALSICMSAEASDFVAPGTGATFTVSTALPLSNVTLSGPRPNSRVSAVSVLEAHIVVRAREHPLMLDMLDRFLEEIPAVVMPFDERQAQLADDAFQRYGKGQGHPAQLNLGDCAVYALARAMGEALLYVGDDFSHTDVLQC